MKIFKKDAISLKSVENALKNNKLSHAYLVIGKDSLYSDKFVIQFVKAIFCLNNNEKNFYSCENCRNCRSIDNGNYIDFYKINSEESTIKKEEIQKLKSELAIKSFYGKKVYWIKDIEKMSPQAANSILKFLEEPEENIIAILSCKNLSAVLPTITSRCQHIRLVGSCEQENNNFSEFENILNTFILKYKKNRHLANLYMLEKFKTKDEISNFFDFLSIFISNLYPQMTIEEDIKNIGKIQESVLQAKADISLNVSAMLVLEKFLFSLLLNNQKIELLYRG
ncbi:DNA polymerase III subunit delta' [Gemella massiliensis]|nr:DNA polymerase III subunit delta' [Gemella massiliensis]AXI26956.1 DNA polymerase III subunit delta' [Gemella sp. ND 6198]